MQNQMEMMKREYEEEIQHLKEAANLNISDKPNDNLDSWKKSIEDESRNDD